VLLLVLLEVELITVTEEYDEPPTLELSAMSFPFPPESAELLVKVTPIISLSPVSSELTKIAPPYLAEQFPKTVSNKEKVVPNPK
jgi:hypothetical protein